MKSTISPEFTSEFHASTGIRLVLFASKSSIDFFISFRRRFVKNDFRSPASFLRHNSLAANPRTTPVNAPINGPMMVLNVISSGGVQSLHCRVDNILLLGYKSGLYAPAFLPIIHP